MDKYATTILDALVSYIDNIDEALAMESMNGLSKASIYSNWFYFVVSNLDELTKI